MTRAQMMQDRRPATSLTARSIDAVFWGAGGAAARMIIQIGAQVALARILGPREYGIFAIGVTVVSFSAFFSDVGLAYGLIQKQQVTPRDMRFVFTCQLVLGLLTAAIAWAASGPIAAFFGEPRAADVVAALAVLCLLNALSAPSLNLLKRRLDQRAIQLASLAAYIAGYVTIGVPLALLGYGVWALVWAWLVQASLQLALLYARVRHPLSPLAWTADAVAQLRYSGTVFVTNLVNWIVMNIDRVVVGRAFGSRDIGLYATSANLMLGPSATLLGVVQTVLFAASSRVAATPAKIGSAYVAVVAGLTLFALPAFVTVSLLAPQLIELLYGPVWRDAAPLLQALALAMPLYLLFGLSTPLLWTAGSPRAEFLFQLPMAMLWLGACVAAAMHGVRAVAWTVLALYALRGVVCAVLAGRAAQVTLRSGLAAAIGGVAVTTAAAISVLGVRWALAGAGPVVEIGAAVAAAVATWILLVRCLPLLVHPQLRLLLDEVGTRLPVPLRRMLRIAVGGKTHREEDA